MEMHYKQVTSLNLSFVVLSICSILLLLSLKIALNYFISLLLLAQCEYAYCLLTVVGVLL